MNLDDALPAVDAAVLADLIDAALPQTQCRRCGYDDCRAYAEAIAHEGAAINRCPPGGAAGIERLAALTGRPPDALDPATGAEGPLRLALIDENWCIGCTLCIAACPVDCIVGAPKRMHTVVAAQCTGCELCVAVCPVDCIAMIDLPGASQPLATGWAAWSQTQASAARERHDFHRQRHGKAHAQAGPAAENTASCGPVPCTDATAVQVAGAAEARLRSQVAAAIARAQDNSRRT
jgi:electron transport complex protein RnfB